MIKINLAKSDSTSDSPFGAAAPYVELILQLPLGQIIAPFALGVAATYAVEYFHAGMIEEVNVEVVKIKSESDEIKKKVSKLKDYENLKKQVEADEKEIRLKLDTINKLTENRSQTLSYLVTFLKRVPEKMWFASIKSDISQIVLEGNTFEFGEVSDFMKSLTESSIFDSVELSSTSQVKLESGLDTMKFEIKLKRRN